MPRWHCIGGVSISFGIGAGAADVMQARAAGGGGCLDGAWRSIEVWMRVAGMDVGANNPQPRKQQMRECRTQLIDF